MLLIDGNFSLQREASRVNPLRLQYLDVQLEEVQILKVPLDVPDSCFQQPLSDIQTAALEQRAYH